MPLKVTELEYLLDWGSDHKSGNALECPSEKGKEEESEIRSENRLAHMTIFKANPTLLRKQIYGYMALRVTICFESSPLATFFINARIRAHMY